MEGSEILETFGLGVPRMCITTTNSSLHNRVSKWSIKQHCFIPQQTNPATVFLLVLFFIWKEEKLAGMGFRLMLTIRSKALYHGDP